MSAVLIYVGSCFTFAACGSHVSFTYNVIGLDWFYMDHVLQRKIVKRESVFHSHHPKQHSP